MAGVPKSRFDDYLRAHAAKKDKDAGGFTHTRIGDTALKINGGSYHIPDAEWGEFMKRYYDHVFGEGNHTEYLTEKQLIEDGSIFVDMDLRYDTAIKVRQHTENHIIDAVMVYMDVLNKLVEVTSMTNIDVFVMEKDNVNLLDTKTKDGIHIKIGVKLHKGLQVLMRKRVLSELSSIWDDLPITNTWDEVLDEGVTKGFVNWQMYGSRKPGHQAYSVKYHWVMTYDTIGDNWTVIKQTIGPKFTERHFEKLSARYKGDPTFSMRPEVQADFDIAKESLGRQGSKGATAAAAAGKPTRQILASGQGCNFTDINSEAVLDAQLEEFFDGLTSSEHKLKETFEYVMSLPVAYYGPGSYSKWIRVGWALANYAGTNGISRVQGNTMFLCWLKFSSQPGGRDTFKGGNGKFDWRNVPDIYKLWCSFDTNNPEGLTHRSIMYWCKSDARVKYDLIRKQTIDYFVEQSICNPTEYDLAMVLYHMYKDRYVCASTKTKLWYEYAKHRWSESEANELRQAISKDMFTLYYNKTEEIVIRIKALTNPEGEAEAEKARKAQTKLAEICVYLKKTQWKNNIMREASEIFYIKDFMDKLDQNPWLMCFNNGVIDFKAKEFRKGQPDDYICKCTEIEYSVYDYGKHGEVYDELNSFFEQLFPDESVRRYMWEFMASVLIGINKNQTFNIFKGSGANGKSKLMELFGKALGKYKGTLPITYLTQVKRNTLGSTSSEVAQLPGVRLAVLNEPSKGDKINEGPLKETTGGDPIQARALFKDTVTFIPQFKMVCCTNIDFEEMANDDGTWRRIRKVDFESKFMVTPYGDEVRFPRSLCPYQFPLDKELDVKFDRWAPCLMSMLVDLAYKLQGDVKDCTKVMASSEKLRESQDYFAKFAKEMILPERGNKVRKTECLDRFKEWYTTLYGSRNVPKGKEICEFMDVRFGLFNKGWHDIKINYDADGDGDAADG